MSFFDKKEEVLDLKLTPYGRYLLSKGKLKPVYYAFLDDDIIYDSDAANFTESNDEIKARIIDETPSLKPHYTMNSVETTINDSMYDDISEQTDQETLDALTQPYDNYSPLSDLNTKFFQDTIGTSDSSKKNAPFWDVLNLRGEITKATRTTNSEVSSSVEYQNDIDTPSLVTNIPQIDVEIEYFATRKNSTDEDYTKIVEQAVSLNLPPPVVYSDNTYIHIEEEELLSRIYERNAFEFDEAFDIQVFKYVQGNGNTSNNWKQLKFLNRPKRIIKDILMDEQEQEEFIELETTPDVVEYYFDIRVDEEIALKDICEAIGKLEGIDDITLDLGIDIDIDCKDLITTPEPPGDPKYCEDVECDDPETTE